MRNNEAKGTKGGKRPVPEEIRLQRNSETRGSIDGEEWDAVQMAPAVGLERFLCNDQEERRGGEDRLRSGGEERMIRS